MMQKLQWWKNEWHTSVQPQTGSSLPGVKQLGFNKAVLSTRITLGPPPLLQTPATKYSHLVASSSSAIQPSKPGLEECPSEFHAQQLELSSKGLLPLRSNHTAIERSLTSQMLCCANSEYVDSGTFWRKHKPSRSNVVILSFLIDYELYKVFVRKSYD